jgi:membrane-associated protease RseP (regulator of RpoE activity)
MKINRYFLHLILFIITFLTTTLAGMEWIYGRMFFINNEGTNFGFGEWVTWQKIWQGMGFSVPFLAFLTIHEFGHYFTAKWHRVRVSLPFYIPLYFGLLSSIGTMGAFIQIRQQLSTRQQFFDIGIAGPLAGFVIALSVLVYGYTNLPPKDYVFEIHPEYKTLFPQEYQQYGTDYEKYAYFYPNTPENQAAKVVGKPIEGGIGIGKNLLMILIETYLVNDKSRIPHPNEMMHYPLLFAGFLGLFFTALNLIPIGQLDGGHILYGLIGKRNHDIIAPILLVLLSFYAGLGLITVALPTEVLIWAMPAYVLFLNLVFSRIFEDSQNTLLLSLSVFASQFLLTYLFPTLLGSASWLLFCLLIGRFLGVYHPPALEDEPLDWRRKALGWLSLLIFVLCFTPQPFL